jgi:4'-phosphopantetheinyl transferase
MLPERGGWPVGPAAPRLADGDVHVWRVDLEVDGATHAALARLLVADERTRAARVRLASARRRFVVARGVLRDVLGRYLGVAPDALAFAYGAQGKPALATPSGDAPALRFNVAHSASVAVCAIGRGREVGVDVEHLRDLDVMRLAARFYAPAEQAALAALPPEVARHTFFRLWACKEAYLKAVGTGVSRPLREVDVALADEPRLAIAGDAAEGGRWTLRELAVDPAYAAALAVEGRGWRLSGWRWQPR